ncbi:hypothetical protein L484_020894 [Morus notabilis]|uniref:Uncharacterized protein n=1 Tax=Morus notabilis TaxID=981085 RepID=W9QGP9_9ROSA|nr:hypothetical protein L484_020894 [Morus notabilis]
MASVQESTSATRIIEQRQQLEYSSKDFQTAFSFIIGLLLALVGVKYQGSGTTLFRENRLIVSLFIMTVCLYAMALVKMTLTARSPDQYHDDDQTSSNHSLAPPSDDNQTPVLLVAGTTASELLLYVLLTPLGWFLVNILALVFLGVQHYRQRRNLFAIFKRSKSSTDDQTTDHGSATNDIQLSNVV